MHVGLMGGTIRRETLSETLDAIVEHDVHHLQYHVPAGLSLAEVRGELDTRQITISALGGTYNMIDPDVEKTSRRIGVCCVLSQSNALRWAHR